MDKNISDLKNTESLKNEHELVIRDKDNKTTSKISIDELYALIKERFNEDFVLQKKITLFDYFEGNPPEIYNAESIGSIRVPAKTDNSGAIITPEVEPTGAWAIKTWPTPNLSKYEFIEVYGITNDYNQIYIKVDNPVNKEFCLGGPIIGANYIFFKSALFTCSTDEIKFKSVWEEGMSNWLKNTACGEGGGGHNIFNGEWGADKLKLADGTVATEDILNEKGDAVKVKQGSVLDEISGVKLNAKVEVVTILKIVGYY